MLPNSENSNDVYETAGDTRWRHPAVKLMFNWCFGEFWFGESWKWNKKFDLNVFLTQIISLKYNFVQANRYQHSFEICNPSNKNVTLYRGRICDPSKTVGGNPGSMRRFLVIFPMRNLDVSFYDAINSLRACLLRMSWKSCVTMNE